MEINCDICNAPFEQDTYADGECPICGQKYEYEEGITMVLTDEQVGVLRKHYKESTFDAMSESCEHVQKEGGDGYECNHPDGDDDPFCYKDNCPLIK